MITSSRDRYDASTLRKVWPDPDGLLSQLLSESVPDDRDYLYAFLLWELILQNLSSIDGCA